MSQANEILEQLGRAAAREVAGDSAVEHVEVAVGEDSSQRPVYRFSFLIDHGQTQMRAGLLRTRLLQKLRDDLEARGDEHLAVIQVLDKEDWQKRANAQPI